METTLGFQFNGWKAGIEWGTSSSSGTYSFSEDSFQWVSFYGGDATLALTNQWNNWIDSTYYAPAQVYKQIIPIQTLISNANISQNIAKAVSDYYSMNQANLHPPVYLKFSFTSSTNDNSGQVVCDYTTTCEYDHGFAWATVEKFATGLKYRYYSFSVPSGYSAPAIIITGCQVTTKNYCTDPGYITFIAPEHPKTYTECGGEKCYGSLGGSLNCCKLALLPDNY